MRRLPNAAALLTAILSAVACAGSSASGFRYRLTGSDQLDMAARRGDLARVTQLLDAGARPVPPAPLTESTLWFAVQSGDISIVRLLLDRGADPRADFEAFVAAAAMGRVDIATLLLERGAGLDMRSVRQDVTGWAAGPGGFDQVRIPEADLAPERFAETMRRFDCQVSAPIPLTHATLGYGDGSTPETRRQVLELLFDRGADPNATDLTGGTLLMLEYGFELDSLLRARGADPDRADLCGRTAADYEARRAARRARWESRPRP